MLLASVPIMTIVSSAHVPTLAIAVQDPTFVTTATSIPQRFSFIDEDNDVSPDDGGLRPHKRRDVDVGGEAPLAIDSEEGDIILRVTVVIYVGENTGVDFEAPQQKEVDAGMLVHPEGEDIVEVALDDGNHALPQQEQASIS